MCRSSVLAFYPWARHGFYPGGSFPHFSFPAGFLRLDIASEVEVKEIVYRMSEILLAAEIAFRRLDRCVSQQELNLTRNSARTSNTLTEQPPHDRARWAR